MDNNLFFNNWQKNISLANLTTFGIGGPAKFLIIVHSNKELINNIIIARKHKISLFILGSGSNVLIADSGWSGLVIKTENCNITISKNKITAESGVKLADLISFASWHGLTGLECYRGIPGTVGGAIVGNAGTKDSWISQIINQVVVIDKNNKTIKLNNQECCFGYRTSRFQNSKEIVLQATFKLQSAPIKQIKEKEQFFFEQRKNQPRGKSAGSIFKNPPGQSAGRLIEQAGLKGKKIGDAQISSQHANFIINTGQAQAKDILTLIKLAQKEVLKKFNIKLELEIKLIGFAKSQIADIIE